MTLPSSPPFINCFGGLVYPWLHARYAYAVLVISYRLQEILQFRKFASHVFQEINLNVRYLFAEQFVRNPVCTSTFKINHFATTTTQND